MFNAILKEDGHSYQIFIFGLIKHVFKKAL